MNRKRCCAAVSKIGSIIHLDLHRGEFMRICRAFLSVIILSMLCHAGAVAEPNKTPPKVLELRVFPSSLQLDNARDARRLVVSGRTPDGFWVDVSDIATI